MSLPNSAPDTAATNRVSASHGGVIDRALTRLGAVSNWQMFWLAAGWVLGGGLLLQLVVLPYLIPQAHWGHGLIAGQDSVGFHINAVRLAGRIHQEGWHVWEFNAGNYSEALASALYAAVYPEPWVVLPINAALFGITAVAVRGLLTALVDSRSIATAALIPFFTFPSFVPIWGQLHRDLNTGAGFLLVLCALMLAVKKERATVSVLTCAMLALAGMGLMWLSRSYAMALVAAATVTFVAVACLGRQSHRGRLCAVAGVVLLAAGSSLGGWTAGSGCARCVPIADPGGAGRLRDGPDLDVAPVARTPRQAPPKFVAKPAAPMTPAGGSTSAASTPVPATRERASPSIRWPRTRYVDPTIPRYSNCLPEPTRDISDRLLFNLCRVREGFVIDGTKLKAGSGYDYDVRLRTLQDFIAYGPRAVWVSTLEPSPKSWAMEKRSQIGQLGGVLVPLEMSMAYGAFLLALVVVGVRLARADVWALVAFCVTYTLFYVFATPQMGTLYRMREFAFTTIVSTAMALIFQRLKPAA